jgi:uncharacterized protein YecE (DUF72 family)
MAEFYAGTSGWAYSGWKPKFYPAKLGSANFLKHYASRLNTVEVNYTFRSIPTEKLLTGWVAATPPDFRFAIKAHQTITHRKRLRDAVQLTMEFISSFEPLSKSKKLGPILFQLPPYLKCDSKLLEDFLAGLPPGPRAAFEFRHKSWFTDEVYGLLRKAHVALCQAEDEKFKTPHVQTADFSYLRLRKDRYSVRAQRALARRVLDLAKRGDVYAYFKHQETPEGALHAEAFLAGAREM